MGRVRGSLGGSQRVLMDAWGFLGEPGGVCGVTGDFGGNLGSQLGEFGGGTGVWGAGGTLGVSVLDCGFPGCILGSWGGSQGVFGTPGVFWGDSPMMELPPAALPPQRHSPRGVLGVPQGYSGVFLGALTDDGAGAAAAPPEGADPGRLGRDGEAGERPLGLHVGAQHGAHLPHPRQPGGRGGSGGFRGFLGCPSPPV